MVVLAAEMNTSPCPASKVEVDEGCSVGEVQHDDGTLQPNKVESTRRRPYMVSEVQRALLVVACSLADGKVLAGLRLGDDDAPLESPISSGSMVREGPRKSPLPSKEAERIDDLHRLRFCRPGADAEPVAGSSRQGRQA